MVGSNKILTVSYGTFSCTLEGFDQPFNTMKSIAEYFRDLAADDRYFGAEPPTPDADMLHRIAEREIQKRVEARVEKNSVVLRQMPEQGLAVTAELPHAAEPEAAQAPAAAPEAQQAEAPAPVAEPVRAETRQPAPVAPKPQAKTPEVKAAPVDEPAVEVDMDSDSVAAKLSRIRAVVARARASRDAEYAEDVPVLDEKPGTPISAAFDNPIAAPSASTDEDYEEIAEPTARASAEPVTLDTPGVAEHKEAIESPQPDASQEAMTETVAEPVEETAIETETEASGEAAAETADVETADVETEAQDDAAEELDVTEVEAAVSEAAALETADAQQADDDDAETVEAEIEVEVTATVETETEALVLGADQAIVPEAEAGNDPDEDAGVVQTGRNSVQARVIKLKRADFEAALAAGEIEELDENPGDTQGNADPHNGKLSAEIRELVGTSSLAPEEADDLTRELAEVERDAAVRKEADDAQNRPVSLAHSAQPSPVNRPEGEQALDRLLNETNVQLGDNEGNRRRSAIAHLKAAVAATKADKLLRGGRDKDEAETLNRFRDDLAKVVRPRRPEGEAAQADGQSARPKRPVDSLANRPAPLMLVSELRIDAPDTPKSAVQPRRIRTGSEVLSSDRAAPRAVDAEVKGLGASDSFSEFVKQCGATELPDILEAAAAYSTFVEGQEHLSRPQLLRRAASLNPDSEISREQGLKSFGHLLRSGRIRKLAHGRFALAEDTKYAMPLRKSGS